MATKTLEKLSKSELYERAQAADVPGRSQMDKDELIEALSDGGRGPKSQAIDIEALDLERCHHFRVDHHPGRSLHGY